MSLRHSLQISSDVVVGLYLENFWHRNFGQSRSRRSIRYSLVSKVLVCAYNRLKRKILKSIILSEVELFNATKLSNEFFCLHISKLPRFWWPVARDSFACPSQMPSITFSAIKEEQKQKHTFRSDST